jgi:hypothetical protein
MRTRGASSRQVTALASGLATLALAGCPEPEPSGPCGSESGDPVLTLTNRGGGLELADGVEVEVFPPPQGGVFTELDVFIDALDVRELEFLRIEIDALETGESLSSVSYFGDAIPLRCTEDEVLVVDYLPVAFVDGTILDELDGVEATVTGTLDTTRGDFGVEHDVVLRSTDY